MDSIFSMLGILDEAEKLWLNAYTEARKNKAAVGMVEWQDAVNAESRLSVSDDLAAYKDYILNKRTNAARWTDDRIDSLIRENGAKGNEEYSKAYAVLMDPKDFLKLTLPNDELELWNERSRSGESKSFRTLNEEDLANESQTPFLQIEAESIRDDGRLDA
jgi:hypothetical protein